MRYSVRYRGSGVARVAVVLLALLSAGCGSGALEGPDVTEDESVASSLSPPATEATGGSGDPGSSGDPGNSGEPGGGDGDEDDYGWGLPEGPYTPDDTFEDDVYVPLAAGDCGEAQAQLDDKWSLLRSPRGVLLYQAGVDVCAGRMEDGRAWYAAAAEHGRDGLDWVAFGGFRYDCELYRSLTSVLEQRDPTGVDCPGGDGPSWPDVDRSVPRDDPRTPSDESTPTGTPTEDATASPTATGTPTGTPTGTVTGTPTDVPTDLPTETAAAAPAGTPTGDPASAADRSTADLRRPAQVTG